MCVSQVYAILQSVFSHESLLWIKYTVAMEIVALYPDEQKKHFVKLLHYEICSLM